MVWSVPPGSPGEHARHLVEFIRPSERGIARSWPLGKKLRLTQREDGVQECFELRTLARCYREIFAFKNAVRVAWFGVIVTANPNSKNLTNMK